MYPSPESYTRKEESGIRRVVEAYAKYLPKYGVELVSETSQDYDLVASHSKPVNEMIDVEHCHGLYWTGDYDAGAWEYDANSHIIDIMRKAYVTTVPSKWVQHNFARGMRLDTVIVPHGIEIDEWKNPYENEGFVLWNKNRAQDVCDPKHMVELAIRNKTTRFITTFSNDVLDNMIVTGVLPHDEMKELIMKAGVYLSTTKETFGIGVLEAMAAGVPVLGFDYGGNSDLVQHCVNGYLARPYDYDDLSVGLAYCLKYRDILGNNGIKIAEQFTWDKAVKKLVGVYELALERKNQKHTVCVVVPVYNKQSSIIRTLNSIKDQIRKPDEVIIIDDGSTDNSAAYIDHFVQKEKNFRYIKQPNQGVAIARNNGIMQSKSKYIVCLDADDFIDKRFIKTCFDALEKDRGIGIAYTGLAIYDPSTEMFALPEWPQAYDYDEFLKGKNQIPTCCMFRREMFDRLGGYKQRYAPHGAGSEDAEFFLRAGAYGFYGKKVTEERLFVYSLGGITSGMQDYKEQNWVEWLPFVTDGIHPFASAAKHPRQSHKVYQYDKPGVSIIIPVGEGHEILVLDALDSIEAQTYRNWEIIVAWDSPNEFKYKNAYPFVKFINTYNGKSSGAGKARNIGARQATSEFIMFLDADDYLMPNALRYFIDEWQLTKEIIYSDYFGEAYVDNVEDLDKDLRSRIIERIGTKTTISHKAMDYDCERAQIQPLIDSSGVPYLWANVTCLMPKTYHDEIGGFDERMPSWEDVDYHWRLAKAGKCYTKIPKELLTYRLHSGKRRQEGIDDRKNIIEYLKEKYSHMITKGCRGCGGQGRYTPPSQNNRMEEVADNSVKDSDFIKCEYKSENTGQHHVVGPISGTNYGYRAGGDVFLVHIKDVKGQTDMFKPLEDEPKVEKVETITVAEPPKPIGDTKGSHNKSADIDILANHGIGKGVLQKLMIDGYMTIGSILEAKPEHLIGIKGIGSKTAKEVILAAKLICGVAS